MGYQDALNKAWTKLLEIKQQDIYSLRFLADEYTVNLTSQTVSSLSCNVLTLDHITILVLHYLIKEIEGLPQLTNQWISFQELKGGKEYYSTFKQRAIEPIVRKYGKSPEALLLLLERFSAKRVQISDFGIVLETFAQVPFLITFWKSDHEFSAEANILFDANIKDIFPTEDIVVLATVVATNI